MSDQHKTREPRKIARDLVALASGLVFALGLALGGMTNPAKVIAFLDIAGAWDPSLAVVMAAAIAVYYPVVRMVRSKEAPKLDAKIHWPTKIHIDRRLLIGSILFGLGWGLAGYCPGPAIVSAASATLPALVLFGSMVLGMIGQSLLIQGGFVSRLLERN